MILPGSTIGMLGGGQLGRMSLLAGRAMGYRFQLYEPATGASARAVADQSIHAAWTDETSLENFASEVDVVSLEFENIPLKTLEVLEWQVPVRPDSRTLAICQNRRLEKTYLRDHGFPHAAFELVEDPSQLKAAAAAVSYPCVAKTTAFGYDGRGQRRLDSEADLEGLWEALGSQPIILEAWIQHRGEYSVIVARNKRGEMLVYPPFENMHRNHILDFTIFPAQLSDALASQAIALAAEISSDLGTLGLLTVELFLTHDDQWIVNEMAPRPHNSGHVTIEACETSQFEQHIRAICDLPLGSTGIVRPGVMVNLLGDVWTSGNPNFAAVLENPGVKLHLYDKGEPRPGRKMGHFTVLSASRDEALKRAMALRESLYAPSS